MTKWARRAWLEKAHLWDRSRWVAQFLALRLRRGATLKTLSNLTPTQACALYLACALGCEDDAHFLKTLGAWLNVTESQWRTWMDTTDEVMASGAWDVCAWPTLSSYRAPIQEAVAQVDWTLPTPLYLMVACQAADQGFSKANAARRKQLQAQNEAIHRAPTLVPCASRDAAFLLRVVEVASRNKASQAAMVVSESGERLSEATSSEQDVIDNAIVQAIQRACLAQNNHRLVNATLYCLKEPDALSVGLMNEARIARVVFHALDSQEGALQSVATLTQGPGLNHAIVFTHLPLLSNE